MILRYQSEDCVLDVLLLISQRTMLWLAMARVTAVAWAARQCTGLWRLGSDTISSLPNGGYGHCQPQCRCWDCSPRLSTDFGLFQKHSWWGRVWTVRWSRRGHLQPLSPWRWGSCHSPGLTRPDTRGPRWGETRSPAETEIHCTQHHFPLKKRKLKPTLVENRTDFIEWQRTEAPARSLSWPHFLDLELSITLCPW